MTTGACRRAPPRAERWAPSRPRCASAPGCCRRSSTRIAAPFTIASQARTSSVSPHDIGRARAPVLTRLAVFVCTFGYIGYFPVAPGTVGSVAGLVLYAVLRWVQAPPAIDAVVIALLF